MFTAVLLTIAKTWKQTKSPFTDEWIKMWYIHTTEYYSTIKKKERMPSAAILVDLVIIIVSEVSQTGKDTHFLIPELITKLQNCNQDSVVLLIHEDRHTD